MTRMDDDRRRARRRRELNALRYTELRRMAEDLDEPVPPVVPSSARPSRRHLVRFILEHSEREEQTQ